MCMVSKEEAIAELAKLLANGAISAEAFTMSVSALNNASSSSDSEANQPPREKTRDEKIYETVMEYIRNQTIAPSTVKYPPFSECKIETEIDSSTFLKLPDYLTLELPKYLIIDEETGKYLLTEWNSYFDAQNKFGAMIRESCSFIFDDNKNLIYAYYTDNGNYHCVPQEIVKDFVIYEDTVEEDLYYKYMSDYMKKWSDWSYLPYNKRMIRTTQTKVFSGSLLDFKGKDIKVTYILTKAYAHRVTRNLFVDYNDVVLVLDGKETFNLIRIITTRPFLSSFGTIIGGDFTESDASKN